MVQSESSIDGIDVPDPDSAPCETGKAPERKEEVRIQPVSRASVIAARRLLRGSSQDRECQAAFDGGEDEVSLFGVEGW